MRFAYENNASPILDWRRGVPEQAHAAECGGFGDTPAWTDADGCIHDPASNSIHCPGTPQQAPAPSPFLIDHDLKVVAVVAGAAVAVYLLFLRKKKGR